MPCSESHDSTNNAARRPWAKGWRMAVLWSLALVTLASMGSFRIATDAQFAFASLALLPVMAVAWLGGKIQGLLAAFLAAAMWLVTDLTVGQPFSAAWVPWANAATRFFNYGLIALLAAQVRSQLDRERTRANHDPLTGLRNSRAFLEEGAREVDRSRRYGHPLAVLFLDLDHFKQLNDTRGHQTGDLALQEIANVLRYNVRSADCVARLGGDEFAILLPEIAYPATMPVADKLSAAIQHRLAHFPPVTVSMGVAWFSVADRPFPEILKTADALMYEVKESGKGAVRIRRFDDAPPGAMPIDRSGAGSS